MNRGGGVDTFQECVAAGATETGLSMLINDPCERCGSGRLGLSCHLLGMLNQLRNKVS
jgi:hypothetical protein